MLNKLLKGGLAALLLFPAVAVAQVQHGGEVGATTSTTSGAVTPPTPQANGVWPGVTISGVPSSGQVPTATGPNAATWQTPASTSIGSVTGLGAGVAAALGNAPNASGGVLLYGSGAGTGTSTFNPGYTAGSWYLPLGTQSVSNSAAVGSATTTYCSPGEIGDVSHLGGGTGTIGALAQRILTLGTSNFQLALYANDTTVSPFRPGALLGATGNIVDTATGAISASLLTPASGVGPGLYWFCLQANDTTAKFQSVPAASTANTFYGQLVGSATLSSVLQGQPVSVSYTGTYGTWPSTLHGVSSVEQNNVGFVFGFEFTSIP